MKVHKSLVGARIEIGSKNIGSTDMPGFGRIPVAETIKRAVMADGRSTPWRSDAEGGFDVLRFDIAELCNGRQPTTAEMFTLQNEGRTVKKGRAS